MDGISQNGLIGAGIGFVIAVIDFAIIGYVIDRLPGGRVRPSGDAALAATDRTRRVLNIARVSGLVVLTAAGYFVGEIALG